MDWSTKKWLNFNLNMDSHFVVLIYKGNEIILDDVLIDTGSGGTVFKMDRVEEIGITIEDDDTIETISGIGPKHLKSLL